MSITKNRFRPNTWPVTFGDAFLRDFFDATPKAFNHTSKSVPAVNILENEHSFHVELAAPGLKKEDFNVAVEENILTISSEVKTEKEENDQKGRFTRKEFSYQSFSRSFTLDTEHVDIDNISANYENGVLSLEIPKKALPESKGKKTIEIK